ncbi:hypothetical protein [Gottfriedia acidiceleris]|uniref:hypothetical protein n=1 Tax=Gottfriedia acidiceleris TaxID=371036 RepID=UPI000B44A3BB|nr:hypothetical protein [Gottfriedia acidiceleris]
MKKLFVSIILVAIVLAIGIFYKHHLTDIKEDTKLKKKIASIIISKDTIDFKNDIQGLNWDQLYLITPYADLKEEIRRMHLKTNVKIESNINYDDTINLMVFIKDKEIVSYVNFPRKKGDFNLVKSKMFEANNSKFKIIKKQNNIVLVQQKK